MKPIYKATSEEAALITVYRKAFFQLGNSDEPFTNHFRLAYANLLRWPDLRSINFIYHVEGLAHQDNPIPWAQAVVTKAIQLRLIP